jgi:DNA polymerase-1
VAPTLNSDGVHVGGISGFLMSMGSAIKLLNPTRCVIIFDGNGGSLKRRKLYPDYKKKKHTTLRLNRAYSDEVNVTDDDIKKQLFMLIKYLDYLPVTTMSIDNIEADDCIAYLATDYFKASKVTIMSADKDFLQLVDDRVNVWSPTKKKLYGRAEVSTEYGIDSNNFVFYRILDGDDSDNIPGIQGAGLKTVKKLFPLLSESTKTNLQEIYNYCENHKSKYKLYNTILENKTDVERNYELMQLTETQIQSFSQLRINEILDKPISKLNKVQFLTMLREDKMWDILPGGILWLNEVFSKLDNFIKEK